MSKAGVRKAIKDFEAPQLQDLIIQLYGKSKEVKEILDFFALPDLEKKTEEYKAVLLKEVTRFTRHAYRPRLPRIRAAIKRFSVVTEAGDEAVAELMVYVVLSMMALGEGQRHRDAFYDIVFKYTTDTMEFLAAHDLLGEYLPRLRRGMSRLKPLGMGFLRNPMLICVEQAVSRYAGSEE